MGKSKASICAITKTQRAFGRRTRQTGRSQNSKCEARNWTALFCSAERLMENLGVRPGAVTPLSMTSSAKTGVQLFIYNGLKSCKRIYVNPLVNDRRLGVTLEGLQTFFDKIKMKLVWVDF